jgi:hypothetical protein
MSNKHFGQNLVKGNGAKLGSNGNGRNFRKKATDAMAKGGG